MADYYTQFSCLFDVKTPANVTRASVLLAEFEQELEEGEDGAAVGFALQPDDPSGSGVLCLYSEEDGEPEHVIAFVQRCADAFGLTGRWGFQWALTCSRPRPDGFGWCPCPRPCDGRHRGVAGLRALARRPARGRKRPVTGSIDMIRRFLDCSSGHLSPETWSWLDAHLGDDVLRDPADRITASLAGGRTRYGWFVYAPEDPDDAIPEDLRRVCDSARKQGAEYVLFDCDALPMEALPILHPDFAIG